MPRVGLIATLVAGAIAAAQAGPDRADATIDDLRAAAVPCPVEAAHCFGLIVHVAPGMDRGLVQGPDWLAGEVATANRLFAPLGIGFTIVDVKPLAAHDIAIMTKRDRNRLGALRTRGGVIDVFVVGRLGDIDGSGEINGVHWRHGGLHWVIVAARAWDLTLGHELGHYFGLPHSVVAASIMNTTPRDEPPLTERVFQPDELDRIRATLRRTLRSHALRDIDRSP